MAEEEEEYAGKIERCMERWLELELPRGMEEEYWFCSLDPWEP